MEFNEKLQELRKQKGLTQEELAESLFVSRTAVSKWESGRGYPNIESLKAIAAFYSVTVDELLSSAELVTIAEADSKQKETHLRDLVFGLLDCSIASLLFLPFFGQKTSGIIHGVSLLALTDVPPYLNTAYFAVVIAAAAAGLLTLALQNCTLPFWVQNKRKVSFILNVMAALLLILSQQPYAAVFTFIILIIKASTLLKQG